MGKRSLRASQVCINAETSWRKPVCLCGGVALGDIDLHFLWQAWHLVSSTFTLCGRRGTWRHRSSLCVARVGPTALGWLWWRARVPLSPWSPRLFVWRAWPLATSGVALGDIDVRFCVAGVALGDIDLCFVWQATDLRRGCRGCLCGRLHFVWQAWRLATSTFTLCGRRGTERQTDRDRQRQTETDRDRQRQTETDRDKQRQTETDRDRQRQTDIHTLQYNTLQYITLHYIHYITLRYVTSHFITFHYINAIHTYIHTYITLHYIHTYTHTYITLHYITLLYIT